MSRPVVDDQLEYVRLELYIKKGNYNYPLDLVILMYMHGSLYLHFAPRKTKPYPFIVRCSTTVCGMPSLQRQNKTYSLSIMYQSTIVSALGVHIFKPVPIQGTDNKFGYITIINI